MVPDPASLPLYSSPSDVSPPRLHYFQLLEEVVFEVVAHNRGKTHDFHGRIELDTQSLLETIEST
jgi:hypothetical protein